jgi:hypothetical protein
MWLGLWQLVRQWSRKDTKVMDELGVEVAKLRKTANLLVRRRDRLVCNGLDCLCRNGNFLSRHNVAQVLHLLKIEEVLLKAQFQALLFKASKQNTQMLKVLIKRAIIDTYAVV